MKIIIATMGSAGDLHPFYAIAKGLQKRGHNIVFLSGATYKDEITELGFTFIPIGTAEGWQHIVDTFDPDKMESIIPAQYKYLIIDSMQPIYAAVNQEYEPGNTVLINWQLMAGARIAHEKLGIPMATVNFAPASFRSRIKPPRLNEYIIPANTPKEYFINVEQMIDSFLFATIGSGINDFRARLGLGPVATIYEWIHSPQKIIGLFPQWFAEQQADWPQQTQLTTFPLYEGAGDKALQPELVQFLHEGEPPVVFTPGSQFKKGKEYFKAAMESCIKLNKRAVFVAKYAEQIPSNLPAAIRHFTYAEFSALLPKAALLVHHGGIGTSAQALQAGIPQLIVPWGLDQYDNAARIKELGVGDELNIKNLEADVFAQKLCSLLDSAAVQEKCRECANKLQSTDPVAATCDSIEQLGKSYAK